VSLPAAFPSRPAPGLHACAPGGIPARRPPPEPPHRGLQRPDKGRNRTPRRKYVVLQVPAIDHVVPGPRKLDPQATRHPGSEATLPAPRHQPLYRDSGPTGPTNCPEFNNQRTDPLGQRPGASLELRLHDVDERVVYREQK